MMNRRMALYGAGATLLSVGLNANAGTPDEAAAYRRIAAECEDNLRKHIVSQWFPRAMDEKRGGYFQNYAEDWSFIDKDDRATVYQGRLTWLAAEAAHRYPAEAKLWTDRSNHGLDFLADHMWDQQYGGFFWSLGATAPYAPDRDGEKHMYGHAFGLYAAATNYSRTKNPRALKLTKDAFLWMEEHAHDGVNGGYVESISREGKKQLTAPPGLPAPPAGRPQGDALGVPFGQKGMNCHIHILEALTATYEAWPDPRVRARLDEVFLIVRDKVATPPGHLHLYFQADWTPAPRAISFGHDVETGFLLAEASQALGKASEQRTWAVSRMLVDQPLVVGFDKERGGFYDESDLAGTLTRTDKIWWVEAEGLNALLLMHDRYGATTPRYWQAFLKQWDLISNHMIDQKNGGWYSRVKADGSVIPGLVKSDRWTEGYHQGRSMLRVSERLRELAGEKAVRKLA
jgi:mannobiose 2-epimerase